MRYLMEMLLYALLFGLLGSCQAEWPAGSYGLVKSQTGCPAFQNSIEVKHDIKLDKTQRLIIKTGSKSQIPLKYCMHNDSSASAPRWPKGSYCIVSNKGKCPKGFQARSIEFEMKNLRVKYLKINSCCRSDGSANSAIRLPTKKEFYLIKNKDNKCQKVKNMDVTEEWILVESPVHRYVLKKTKDLSFPTKPKWKAWIYPRFYLCKYSRST